MEELEKYSLTELLKIINDKKQEHEILKQEIVDHTIEVDELEIKINQKLQKLSQLEKEYVELIEEISKRNGV